MTAIAGPSSSTGAFDSKSLTAVTIPSGITSIGTSAFYGNQLTNVIIPDSVTVIGMSAFESNQLNSVVLPSSIAAIGGYAFYDNQLTSVVIPESVTIVEEGTFANNQLTSIVIPEGVTSIKTVAFMSNKLTELTLPSSITSFGTFAFGNNYLTALTIPDSVTTIGHSAFDSNSLTSVVIEGNPTLATYAFGINGLNRSTLPAGMTWDQQLTYYQDNASLVNIYATDPNFIATYSPGRLYTYTSGGTTYAASGYLINPASATITHESSSGSEIAPQTTIVGKTSDGTLLTTYSLAATLDTTTNPASPTIDFAAYYKAGDTITIEPNDIPGYVLPSSFTTTLSAGDNPESLVYLTQAEVDANTTPSSTPTPPNTDTTTGRLAETGMHAGLVAVGAVVVVITGGVIVRKTIRF